MAVVVAPAAPEAGLLVATALVVCLWIALLGLKYGYAYTFGAFLRRLAAMVGGIWIVGGRLSDAFLAADHWVESKIAAGIGTVETVIARLWNAMAWVIEQTGEALASFAGDVTDAIDALTHATVPQIVRTIVRPVERTVVHTTKVITHQVQTITRTVVSDAVALPRVVAGEIRDRHMGRRLTRLEKLVGVTALTGVVAGIIARRWPWMRCSNVSRWNRAMCRANPDLLEALIAATTILALGVSIRQLTRDCQAVTEPLMDGVKAFVTEL